MLRERSKTLVATSVLAPSAVARLSACSIHFLASVDCGLSTTTSASPFAFKSTGLQRQEGQRNLQYIHKIRLRLVLVDDCFLVDPHDAVTRQKVGGGGGAFGTARNEDPSLDKLDAEAKLRSVRLPLDLYRLDGERHFG